jgi:hypothetical protein
VAEAALINNHKESFMSRGGVREGAGRKKGVPNKKTAELQAEVAAGGILPLDYMLKVLRDEDVEPNRRDDMAKWAAPYVHPKLQAIQHTGKDGGPIEHLELPSDLELAKQLCHVLSVQERGK